MELLIRYFQDGTANAHEFLLAQDLFPDFLEYASQAMISSLNAFAPTCIEGVIVNRICSIGVVYGVHCEHTVIRSL